jgi:AraC family transcriptional regulator
MNVTRHLAISQQQTERTLHHKITTPLLYLSSAEAGWEGVKAQAFHEPMELEGWITPTDPDVSLVLFTGGTMRIEQRYTNGPWQARNIHQGDLILRSGANHMPNEVRWRGLSTAPTQTLHLNLSQDLVTRMAEEVADYDPTQLVLVERSGFQDPLLTQIGFALWRELEQRSPGGKLYAQTAAQLLTMHLLRHYTSTGASIKRLAQGQRLSQQQMRQVQDFVQAHLSQDLSLETLAQQTGFSPYYFTRMFRQTTGESPHQFVLRQRIEHAQHLLKETDLPIAHVALESGFANQSHLTQAFKRQIGLAPRAYRQDRSICAGF